MTVSVVSYDSLSLLQLFFHICQAIFHSFSDVFYSVSKKTLLSTFTSKDIQTETHLE